MPKFGISFYLLKIMFLFTSTSGVTSHVCASFAFSLSRTRATRRCAAILDSGSTTTLLFGGMLDLMPALKSLLKPTSLGFFGVAEDKLKYDGMLYDFDF